MKELDLPTGTNTPLKNEDVVVSKANGSPEVTIKTLAEVERAHVLGVLETVGGNKTQAANILGITIKTLYNKLHEYGEFEKYAVKKKASAPIQENSLPPAKSGSLSSVLNQLK